MNFKFTVSLLLLLSVLFVLPSTSSGYSSQSMGPGPTTLVIADSYYLDSVDPAKAYDSSYPAGLELIANVYDTLVAFKGSDPTHVVSWLAEAYSVSPDGLTYQFVIRQNVPWQNSSYGLVTTADVEYSLERMLVRDYDYSPAYAFWYPIFGIYEAADFGNLTDPAVAAALGNLIDGAITSNATAVTIHFQTGKAYSPYLGILAQTPGSILSKQWCIDQGDWNPAVDRLDDGTWVNAHNPGYSPLDTYPSYKMMGSGPYKLDYIDSYRSWSIVRNIDFWGGWDANRGSLRGIQTPSLGYLERITRYYVSEYSARLAGFTGANPIYDSIFVPRWNIASVWQQPGIRSVYPFPVPAVDAMFFSYNVSTQSPFIGAGSTPGFTFGQTGIRPDFFSDIHARKAVAYSFNWSAFISTAYSSEAQQPVLPLPVSDAFYNSSLTGYCFSFAKAIEEWKMAWGGSIESPGPVWTNGFRFTIAYPGWGNPRGYVAELLKTALESENVLFHVDLCEFIDSYGQAWHGGPGGHALAPIYMVGAHADYQSDADDWVTLFIESTGTLAYPQHIDMDPYSPLMDNLIEWGRRNSTFDGRNYNYQRLWQMYTQQVPSVPLEEPIGRYWERDWVQGSCYNPAYPGVYAYTMWKQALPWEDVNSDGKVDIRDLATAAKVYGAYYIQPLLSPYPSGPPGLYSPNWNCKADVNVINATTGARGDMKIDIRDLATIAKLYGYTAPEWQPPP